MLSSWTGLRCRSAWIIALAFAPGSGTAIAQQTLQNIAATTVAPQPPAWSYPVLPSTAPPNVPDDGVRRGLEGSAFAFTLTELFDLFTVHDWFPASHPAMPGDAREPLGQRIATQGNGKTTPCVACHGPELRGVGNIPPLAGRSSQYLFRQLYDMQQGVRQGAAASVMRDVVASLSSDDMLAVVAYASSREP